MIRHTDDEDWRDFHGYNAAVVIHFCLVKWCYHVQIKT